MKSEEIEEVKIERARERLIRWEEGRREYLSSAIKVILVLATGLLGFIANIKQRPIPYSAYWWIYLLLGSSILFAIAAGYTRFFDFRHTAELNRLKYHDLKKGLNSSQQKQKLRDSASTFGTLTNTFVILQAKFFASAVCILCLI